MSTSENVCCIVFFFFQCQSNLFIQEKEEEEKKKDIQQNKELCETIQLQNLTGCIYIEKKKERIVVLLFTVSFRLICR